MSDFLFSSMRREPDDLSQGIRQIYRRTAPEVWEYHGPWGTLAVSRGHYHGFDPVETETHICVVIGGPVLCFRDNAFFSGGERDAGTQAVLARMLSGEMAWEHDVSGPFVVLLVDKVRAAVTCVTDLMMFIPVYEHHKNGGLVLGTHVDAVAAVCGKANAYDEASLVDFILHDVVTYPYTAYDDVRQLVPAAEHTYAGMGEGGVHKREPKVYWEPVERTAFANIDEAADALRSGLQDYVTRITAGVDHVAQFISGGEDSRALAGLLPANLKRDAYIFLDSMNREGRVAELVAAAYGARFYPRYRSPTHYLEILEEASSLVGLGHQYLHAHSLGFHSECKLDEYPAVFGGYLSDSLLKAAYARKPRGYGRLPFLPEIALSGESRSRPVKGSGFRPDLLRQVEARRLAHLERVRTVRPRSAHEWFVLWPMTMRTSMPNFYSTRRLFASYEPFLSHPVVKASASVPTRWKLNRRLFLRMARPWLEPARSVQHGDGRFPHLSWLANAPLQATVWAWRQGQRKILRNRANEGPWHDWKTLRRSSNWDENLKMSTESKLLGGLLESAATGDQRIFVNDLPRQSQLNLFQVLALARRR